MNSLFYKQTFRYYVAVAKTLKENGSVEYPKYLVSARECWNNYTVFKEFEIELKGYYIDEECDTLLMSEAA